MTNLNTPLDNPTTRHGFNVKDEYKNLPVETIKTVLDKTRSDLIFVFVNIHGDFNLSSGIRNSNWFNQAKVIILGRRRWDRRGAVGTQHYIDVEYYSDVNELVTDLRADGYTLVGAEYPSETSLPDHVWDRKTAVFFGEEQAGLSEEVLTHMDNIVSIPGAGSVRSLNVSTTSGIFAYDYFVKLKLV